MNRLRWIQNIATQARRHLKRLVNGHRTVRKDTKWKEVMNDLYEVEIRVISWLR